MITRKEENKCRQAGDENSEMRGKRKAGEWVGGVEGGCTCEFFLTSKQAQILHARNSSLMIMCIWRGILLRSPEDI